MSLLLSILGVLVVLGTIGVLLYNLKTKKYELLSLRNLFLLGFAHFFGIGTYFTMVSGSNVYGDRGRTLLFGSILIFLVVFFIAQRIGIKWDSLRRVIPAVQLPVTRQGINFAILALLGAGFLGAVLPNTGYLPALYSQLRVGMPAAAVALATYNLLARKFNPIAWLMFLGTLGFAALLSTVGDIGRRSLLGVILAVGWIWYYYSLRYRPAGPTAVKIGALLICGFFALVVFAGFRGHGAGSGVGRGGYSLQTRIQQFAEVLANPTIASGDVTSSIISDAPTNSMFIMENYPDVYPYDPFNGAKFLLSNPIPRFLWPEKPRGLGIVVQEQLQSPANLGVGILGHGWAEGGWIGVIGYAAFFGLLTAGLDNLIRQRMWNPYFLAALGSSLGNVYALPRGETSLFLLQVINSFVGVIAVLYLLKLFLGPVMLASQPLVVDGNRWAFEPEDELADEHYPEYDYTDDYAYAADAYAPHDPAPPTYRATRADRNEAA